MSLNVDKIRQDFPILSREINGHPLVYLDSGASTLKPKQFVDRICEYYLMGASNVHRGVHQLSEQATKDYEETREKVRKLIHASSLQEIVFNSGTTAGLNTIARGLASTLLDDKSELIVSEMEHHSNIVPWQMAARKTGAKLRMLPITEEGDLDLVAFKKMLNPNTKVVAINAVSNSLGTINPVKQICALAHENGALVVVDAAQAIAHLPVNVQDWDCDFLCFSGHKLFSSTGTGVLYGKKSVLETIPPDQGGGDMIEKVSFSGTTYADLPARLEAGTPNIGGFIGLGASIDYFQALDIKSVMEHEDKLLAKATSELSQISGLKIIGNAKSKIAIVSFVIEGIHAHDLGSVLDMRGIAVRTGHHCTMPVNDKFNVGATTRASFSIYNCESEIDRLVDAIKYAKAMFL